ncbi:hypothetical protein BU26DRAFT_565804 [Trematosphaeria pertusa]|uniref:Jacalin-type lectin domain-containing protein n=1 Tax=Trematosphaeria pertusa TaxID=390896 RepID=A0A6A6IDX2_9PLEO|nr:uncharacterized protein BU26DRAFT_565804 [Trematosphaeria pertusa]KAF2248407.1 hypothetical protein BU26DRAFT_565804 [Trematosphaeria pertusa]
MFFNARALFLGAAALFFGLSAADDCAQGPWQDVQYVGGQGGSPYCHTKYLDGTVMTGIEVWASKKEVEAIQFYYSDGTNSGQLGKVDKNKKHARLDWDSSTDGISQVKTWGNGKGESLGRVYIRTKGGAELDVGKDTDGQDTYESKTASGILLGAFGRSGEVIDGLGLLFLKSKIDKITVEDMVFKETPDQLNAQMKGLQTVILDYADHTNANTDSNETFTFTKTETRTTSKKYSQTATHTFGWSNAIELSGKILDLGASSTTTLKYEYSRSSTEESTQEKGVQLAYSVSTALKPGQRVFCRATAMSGEYKGDYTANVHIWLEDGGEFKFAQDGTMEQVNWSQASSICQDKEFPPDDAVPEVPASKRALKFIA